MKIVNKLSIHYMKLTLYVIVKHQGKNHLLEVLYFLLYRDIIIYALSCRTSGLERVIELLSQTIFHPKLLPEEVSVELLSFFDYSIIHFVPD
jgi:hypothetical protein